MTTRAEATAAPTTIKLGDRLFQMSPMTDEDHGIMDQWIQARHLRIARETLPENTTDKQRELTERVALSQASVMTFMSGTGLLLMENPEAISMLFWCGIRHNHSDITPEEIQKMLIDPKNRKALQAEWNRINNDLKESADPKVKKKIRKRKAAKRSKRRNR